MILIPTKNGKTLFTLCDLKREVCFFLFHVVNRANFVWSEWSKWNEFVWSALWF